MALYSVLKEQIFLASTASGTVLKVWTLLDNNYFVIGLQESITAAVSDITCCVKTFKIAFYGH